MDLTLKIRNNILNIRTEAVIIHNNKVLLQKKDKKERYQIIGGRVNLGENSRDACIREVKEEIGKDIEILSYVATIENFYTIKNVKHHEILFLHRAEFINEEDKKIEYTLENKEGKSNLKYYWVDIDELDNLYVLPEGLKTILENIDTPQYLVTNEKIRSNMLQNKNKNKNRNKSSNKKKKNFKRKENTEKINKVNNEKTKTNIKIKNEIKSEVKSEKKEKQENKKNRKEDKKNKENTKKKVQKSSKEQKTKQDLTITNCEIVEDKIVCYSKRNWDELTKIKKYQKKQKNKNKKKKQNKKKKI